MYCFDCGNGFKKDDTVFEFTSGVFDGEAVVADNSIEAWCENCEEKRGEK